VANEEYVIGPLGKQHNRAAFRCADHHITNYFRRHALVNMQSRIANVWVLHDPGADRVVGFYTLSTTSADFSTLPEQFTTNLPRYPVPVVLLGRMGVDRRYERQGFGKWLVIDALMRVYRQDVMAVYGMVVDPKEGVRDFYTKNFNFVPLGDNSDHLFLHLETFMKTLTAGTPSE
jgi:GNAT superfamily N-acetyltransferase